MKKSLKWILIIFGGLIVVILAAAFISVSNGEPPSALGREGRCHICHGVRDTGLLDARRAWFVALGCQ